MKKSARPVPAPGRYSPNEAGGFSRQPQASPRSLPMNSDSIITYEAALTTADVTDNGASIALLQTAGVSSGLNSRQSDDAQHGCRRSLHRQEVSCSSSSTSASVSDIVNVEAEMEAQVNVDVKRAEPVAVYEMLAETPEVQPPNNGTPSNVNTEPGAGAQAGTRRARMCKCSLADLNAEEDFHEIFNGRPKLGRFRTPVQFVKHTEPNELLALERLLDTPRLALLGFLKRHSANTWMQKQNNYVQKAAIAAAHALTGMWRSYGEYVDYPGQWCQLQIDDFEVVDFLNCGWSRKTQNGSSYFFQCEQPEYCPSCNHGLRVKPATMEFLRAFSSDCLWYSITVMATSDPAKAGVKMFAGYDEAGDEIYEPLVMLSEMGDRPKLPKYDSQCWVPYMVASGLWSFMLWLIAGHDFDGLHVAGENDFTYYPDLRSAVGVSHTVNPHFHAYGNTKRPIDRRRALFMLRSAVNHVLREGGGQLWAYPDIALRPILSPTEMKKTINYVFKPWNFAKCYIDALARGCPLDGLNLEFQSTYFGSERLLCPFPSSSGLSKWGAKLGNMSQRAGKDYIGTPLPVLLSSQQVKRFLERDERNETWDWECKRYTQHLRIRDKIKQRRVRPEIKEMEATMVDDKPGCDRGPKLALRPEVVAADECRRIASSKQSSPPCLEKPAAAPPSKPSRQPAPAQAQERLPARSQPSVRRKPVPADELTSSAPPAAQQPQTDTPSASPLPPGGGLRRRLARAIASLRRNPSPNGHGPEAIDEFVDENLFCGQDAPAPQ